MASKANMTLAQRVFLFHELVVGTHKSLVGKYLKRVPALFLQVDEYGRMPELDSPYHNQGFFFRFIEVSNMGDFSREHFVAVEPTHDSVLDKRVCSTLDEVAERYAEKRIQVPSREWYEKAIDAEDYTVEVDYENCMTEPRTKLTWNGVAKQVKKERRAMARGFKAQRKKLVDVFSEARLDVLEVNKVLKGAARDLVLVDSHEAKQMLEDLEKQIAKVLK